ncbi:putative quinol monooxygenase [Methanofollis fontis]|uniref:Antibiotic biosynthesis monooxygenase n=1 Tax=Methanofollis fontis TaxID=2052832 RepID=A0A483CWB7_9EURY|nr:putative quinol monooxygenase [Methanofollis fontis]TAJ45877.1 antibiotic biosynthesis monooxygenase [Methanofollis fontis]
MLLITARCNVKPESVDDFLDLAQSMVQKSRNEGGNISYDLYADLNDSNGFTFVEAWADQKAIDLHNASEHFKHFVDSTGPLFAGPLDINLYRKMT